MLVRRTALLCQPDSEGVVKNYTCGKEERDSKLSRENTKNLLTKIMTLSSENSTQFNSVEEFFASLGTNQEAFEHAYRLLGKTEVIMKRQLNEHWINPFNKSLLSCWNANMDIHFVVDAYACIVYFLYLKS